MGESQEPIAASQGSEGYSSQAHDVSSIAQEDCSGSTGKVGKTKSEVEF
jgi:hypothetical protein